MSPEDSNYDICIPKQIGFEKHMAKKNIWI